MGRRRKDQDENPLPVRTYKRRGAFYYVHRDGTWEPLGSDEAAARHKAKIYNDPDGLYGTIVYWMERFLIDCEARVAAGKMSQRTLDDYREAIQVSKRRDGKDKGGALSIYFAPPMVPTDVTPNHIKLFLDAGAKAGRAVRANREKACFSAFMSWLITQGEVPGLIVNPCLRASGVRRNPESKRELYVPDADYSDVWAAASASVRILMDLTYRTLQRPESDIIHWTTEHVKLVDADGAPYATRETPPGARRRVLDFEQHKTGRRHRIAFSAEMDDLIPRRTGAVAKLREPLVKRLDGHPYTYDGISAMLKKAIAKANRLRAERGQEPIRSFGFRDLKGKGATDMYFRDKVPIEQIQQLLGHANVTITEIYIKQRWREAATPNQVQVR